MTTTYNHLGAEERGAIMAMKLGGMSARSIGQALVFDTDHRAGHLTEAMAGLGVTLKHLDPIKDCLKIGTVNGAVPTLGSLVAERCARAKVLVETAPVLCLSKQHELDRAVLLAMPFVAQGNTEPSPP